MIPGRRTRSNDNYQRINIIDLSFTLLFIIIIIIIIIIINYYYYKLLSFQDIPLTLKCQSRLQQTTVLNIFHCFSDKIMLDTSCEFSAWQRIHMKHQALFSSKDKSKNNESVDCCNFAWRFNG